jgi:hypothetical protein
MSLSSSIILGVISGVLTTSLVYLVVNIFNKIIIPWYKGIMYNGLDISGSWKEIHNYKNVMIQESTINVKQKAHQIKGEIILVKKGLDDDDDEELLEAKVFKFQGEFYDGFLNVSCWNKNKKQIGLHNYLLKVSLDGGMLNGSKTWFDILSEKFENANITWKRKE